MVRRVCLVSLGNHRRLKVNKIRFFRNSLLKIHFSATNRARMLQDSRQLQVRRAFLITLGLRNRRVVFFRPNQQANKLEIAFSTRRRHRSKTLEIPSFPISLPKIRVKPKDRHLREIQMPIMVHRLQSIST